MKYSFPTGHTTLRCLMFSLLMILAVSPATVGYTPPSLSVPVTDFRVNPADSAINPLIPPSRDQTGWMSQAPAPGVVEFRPGFKPDPYPLSGLSGGMENSKDCGQIAVAPNHQIRLTEDFPYLRFRVQNPGGSPTLLIEGPAGRFCILPEQATSDYLDLTGYMPQGTYSIYIGSRTPSQSAYTLSISQQP